MSATSRLFHEEQDNKDEMIQELLEVAEKALVLLKQCVEQAKAGVVPVVTISAFQDMRIIEECIFKARGA